MNHRKFILSSLGVIAMAVACYAGIQSFTTQKLDEKLLLQNIEALTQNNDEGSSESWDCWSELKNDGGGVWRCGNPCEFVDHSGSKSGKGKCYKKKK